MPDFVIESRIRNLTCILLPEMVFRVYPISVKQIPMGSQKSVLRVHLIAGGDVTFLHFARMADKDARMPIISGSIKTNMRT